MKGTPFYRRQFTPMSISQMLSLVAHSCPPQAIAVAFGLDKCTLTAWQRDAGGHCQEVHEALV